MNLAKFDFSFGSDIPVPVLRQGHQALAGRTPRRATFVRMNAGGGDLGQGGGSLTEKLEGAREAFAGEVETNFTDKSLGNPDIKCHGQPLQLILTT